MAFGIALAGGGTRGAAHVGVLLALKEEGMIPSSISGTSAGAIVAGLYATGMSPEELRETVIYLSQKGLKYIDPDYFGIIKLIPEILIKGKISISGLIKGNKLEKYLCNLTNGKNIKDVCIRTVIPAVDLNSGCTIAYTNAMMNFRNIGDVRWKTDIAICEAMRASAAVPAVFQPKFIDDMCLVDGGVTNILPVDLLMAAGENNILAIDIGEDYEMPNKDNMIEVASHSLSIMTSCLKQCTSQSEKLLLKPNLPKEAGLLTFEYMEECMEAGYEDTKRLMPVIKDVFQC